MLLPKISFLKSCVFFIHELSKNIILGFYHEIYYFSVTYLMYHFNRGKHVHKMELLMYPSL